MSSHPTANDVNNVVIHPCTILADSEIRSSMLALGLTDAEINELIRVDIADWYFVEEVVRYLYSEYGETMVMRAPREGESDNNGCNAINTTSFRILLKQLLKLPAVNSKFETSVGFLINPANGNTNGLHRLCVQSALMTSMTFTK